MIKKPQIKSSQEEFTKTPSLKEEIPNKYHSLVDVNEEFLEYEIKSSLLKTGFLKYFKEEDKKNKKDEVNKSKKIDVGHSSWASNGG